MELVPNMPPLQLKQKIIEKLGWLSDYELDLIRWQQMLTLTRRVETQLKQSGIHHQSLEYFLQNKMPLVAEMLNAKQNFTF
jgi:hypothetical protein